ncbi:MAG: hypothetical protein M1114_00240 [Candidatus Dependentiae bacterium]|nr:hypothetical protein [Candidatus Dependentiae bacterium]
MKTHNLRVMLALALVMPFSAKPMDAEKIKNYILGGLSGVTIALTGGVLYLIKKTASLEARLNERTSGEQTPTATWQSELRVLREEIGTLNSSIGGRIQESLSASAQRNREVNEVAGIYELVGKVAVIEERTKKIFAIQAQLDKHEESIKNLYEIQPAVLDIIKKNHDFMLVKGIMASDTDECKAYQTAFDTLKNKIATATAKL